MVIRAIGFWLSLSIKIIITKISYDNYLLKFDNYFLLFPYIIITMILNLHNSLVLQRQTRYRRNNVILEDAKPGDNTYIKPGMAYYDISTQKMQIQQEGSWKQVVICNSPDTGNIIYVGCSACYVRPPKGCNGCGLGSY